MSRQLEVSLQVLLPVPVSIYMAFVMLNVKILYPTDVSFEDSESFNEYIATLPWQAFALCG